MGGILSHIQPYFLCCKVQSKMIERQMQDGQGTAQELKFMATIVEDLLAKENFLLILSWMGCLPGKLAP